MALKTFFSNKKTSVLDEGPSLSFRYYTQWVVYLFYFYRDLMYVCCMCCQNYKINTLCLSRKCNNETRNRIIQCLKHANSLEIKRLMEKAVSVFKTYTIAAVHLLNPFGFENADQCQLTITVLPKTFVRLVKLAIRLKISLNQLHCLRGQKQKINKKIKNK